MPSYYVAIDRFGNYDLSHYGIKGQKWGIRRFQDANGRLTREGIARYLKTRKEIRAENKKAFALGREATIAGKAADIAQKKYDNGTVKNQEKNKKILEEANKKYREALSKGEKHYKQLLDKYGSDSVTDIKYGKNGKISERVVSGKKIAASVLLAAAGMPLGGLAAGFILGNVGMHFLSDAALSAIMGSGVVAGGVAGGSYGKRSENKNNKRSYKESKRKGINKYNKEKDKGK